MSKPLRQFSYLINRPAEDPGRRITAVEDRLGGKVLHVFSRKWEPGSIVKSGDIMQRKKKSIEYSLCLESTSYRIIKPATHQTARSMANKAGATGVPLATGFWHEVITD